jgi:DtxR family transcriptional regulator, Mn-dependent transcriptional regulator
VVASDASPTKSEREALKAVYRLTRDGGEASTGALAEALGLTAGTVTATLKRLGEQGLVDYRPYRGVALTEAGGIAAVGAIRRHRIVERFLADMLGYAWNEADRYATAFEHELPPEVLERIFVALDRPDACPHGFPIPEPEMAAIPDTPDLYSLNPGDEAHVAVPGRTDPAVIAFLETLGLRPGVSVRVVEKHPFDGPLVLTVDGIERTLGANLARQIFVTSRESERKQAS